MEKIDFQALAAPFPPEDIEWRASVTTQDKKKTLALAYVTNRAIMQRLDDVCGPDNWKNDFREWRDKGVLCSIAIKSNGEWIAKWDGADRTDIEATKGGFSGSMKRAAVEWGIGRYLYNLKGVWWPCKASGKSIKLEGVPPLPSWALPEDYKGDGKGTGSHQHRRLFLVAKLNICTFYSIKRALTKRHGEIV
jgi:hypothetical protein